MDQFQTEQNGMVRKAVIDSRINDISTQNWLGDVNERCSCLNYRLFKKNLRFENYLTNLSFRERISFTKFRCANGKLPANRSHELIFESTTCFLCDSGDVGDAYHYLLVCEAFNSRRRELIKPYYRNHPNILKFEKLMSLESGKNLKNLIKMIDFILHCFNV